MLIIPIKGTDCILNASDPTDPSEPNQEKDSQQLKKLLQLKPKRKDFLLNSPRENL